jgi:hypothetical protein
VWVKAHTPVLAREGAVTRLLAALRPDLVPTVLATDDDRCWLVTSDAGSRLRQHIATADDVHRLAPVLVAYADLQRAAAASSADLVAAGALDRRSPRLAGLLSVVCDGPVPPREEPHALAPDEVARLRALVPRVSELADRVCATVPDSIDHSDLHDGNMFVAGDRLTLGDFGDATVGTPFVSLVVLERSLGQRLGLDPDGPELDRLRTAYLEPWTDLAPRAELVELARAVRPLGLLGRGLTWRSLVAGVDDPALDDFADGWPGYARELLDAFRPGGAPR